jgi:hypothetical protein
VRGHRSDWARLLAVTAGLFVAVLAGSASALAQTGGSGPPGGTTTDPAAPAPAPPTGVPAVATLAPDGSAIPPSDAPIAVRKAIMAGNRIHTMPYVWGGGHNRKFKGRGYDCSGAVSYVLHAAGMLKSPLSSGPLARSWGLPGIGQWITVYANKSHAYAVVAGLRWDTSAVGEALNQGSGPRWRTTQRSPVGYTSRFFPGY